MDVLKSESLNQGYYLVYAGIISDIADGFHHNMIKQRQVPRVTAENMSTILVIGENIAQNC